MSFEIDLSEFPSSSSFEISIDDLERKYMKDAHSNSQGTLMETDHLFKCSEIEINESTASIYYTQSNIKLLIAIYGPKETRIRDKVINDQANIEVNTKLNKEQSKEKNIELNSQISKFLRSVVLTTSYPKCSIHFCINILSNPSINASNDINYLLLSVIFNGLMVALCLSGIDLKALALSKGFIDSNERSVLVSLDANTEDDINDTENELPKRKANVLLIESNFPMQIDAYKTFIESTQKTNKDFYHNLKLLLYKKLKLN